MRFNNFITTSSLRYYIHENFGFRCDQMSFMAVMFKAIRSIIISMPFTGSIHKRYKITCSTMVLLLVFAFGTFAGESKRVKSPVRVGDLVLGKSINEFKDRIKKDSRMCIRFQEYLQEMEVKMCAGFKSGLISIANCSNKDEILRIKLKYKNNSKKFFNKLLKRFKEKFGTPNKWKGDPFGVLLIWKWSFKNKKGEKISLILQHNDMDRDFKMGNVVKLANTTRIEQEQDCFFKKNPRKKRAVEPPPLDLSKPDTWNYLVPN